MVLGSDDPFLLGPSAYFQVPGSRSEVVLVHLFTGQNQPTYTGVKQSIHPIYVPSVPAGHPSKDFVNLIQ